MKRNASELAARTRTEIEIRINRSTFRLWENVFFSPINGRSTLVDGCARTDKASEKRRLCEVPAYEPKRERLDSSERSIRLISYSIYSLNSDEILEGNTSGNIKRRMFRWAAQPERVRRSTS